MLGIYEDLKHMEDVRIYFSDFFDVSEELIKEYGAVNISLINDLPLFIDPFLLFNSDNIELRAIHDEMISYLKFLQIHSEEYKEPNSGMLNAWYTFSEVKQTWLGFSQNGNSGRGLGYDFAKNLHKALSSLFRTFGQEIITHSSHMEKLCLLSPNVGRDKISDFTTSFSLNYLLQYTEKFAKKYINKSKCSYFNVPRVRFDYESKTWVSRVYYLPCFNNDYVLLTPKCILTRDDTFINRCDLLDNLRTIAPSVDDSTIRFELENYLNSVFDTGDKKLNKKEKDRAAEILLHTHPEIIDYYLKYKEDHEQEATSISREQVEEVELLFHKQVSDLVSLLKQKTDFYNSVPDAYEAAYQRVLYLKHVIEDQDGYRALYLNDSPIANEKDLHVMYRLTWFGSSLDVNSEVNNGRGPVDYKVSHGKKNSSLVEFKLASNSKMKQNLEKQVEIYKKASETNRAIKVILYFNKKEFDNTTKILNELGLNSCHDIVLIDARRDNKPSASNAK